MDYALPSAWGQGSRGFWTKRKKTATSLLAVLAMIAGIAVAFKLFDQTVPNNVVRDASIFDYDILVQRAAAAGCTEPVRGGQWCDASGDNPIFARTELVRGTERPVSQYPGDTRAERVMIVNTNDPARDASFLMHIENIVVERCPDAAGSEPGTDSGDFDPETGECANGAAPVVVAEGDPSWNRFVNFWEISVDKETYLQASVGPLGGEDETGGMEEACSGGLKTFTEKSPCELGTVRGAGSETFPSGAASDEREYDFKMYEDDDGTDQSEFRGWSIVFDFVFNAKVPADTEGTDPGTR